MTPLTENAIVLDLFKECDALLQGHFKLTSGKHSEWYFEKIRLIEKPGVLEKIIDLLVEKIRAEGGDFDYVISPAYGAIAIGFLAALKLDKKFAFSQRIEEKMGFRSGWAGLDGSRVGIVGGGPAGSFAALHLIRRARERGRTASASAGASPGASWSMMNTGAFARM